MIRIGGPASPYDSTYYLLTRFHKIAEIVRRERPDVLEIHSPYLAALGALRADPNDYGVRTFQWHSDFIDTYAGVLERTLSESDRPFVRAASHAVFPATIPLWGLVRGIARRCDGTLVAARWQAEKLALHGIGNVKDIPFGIERSIFRPEAKSEGARSELKKLAGRGPDDDVPVFVGVGRFAIEKRWDVVIDAFARFREDHDAVLVLLGDGPERERMQRQAESRGTAIAMPGFVRDRHALASMLASADALVHGCPFETFGLSIAEAMSAGLPVVVPDQGGAAEMHDPSAGERYTSGDPEACARAMARIFERIRKDEASLRAAAAKRAGKLPDVRGQFERQIALYEELLTKRHKPGFGGAPRAKSGVSGSAQATDRVSSAS